MEDNVKNLLILIVVLLIVRWAAHLFLPFLGGLIDPLCAIAFLWGLWVYVLKPLLGRR